MALRLDPFQTLKRAYFKAVDPWRGLLMSDSTLEDMSSEIGAKIVDEENPKDHPFYKEGDIQGRGQSFLLDIGNDTAKWVHLPSYGKWESEEGSRHTPRFMVNNDETEWIPYRKSDGELVETRFTLDEDAETLEMEVRDSEGDVRDYAARAYIYESVLSEFYLCDISPCGRYILFGWMNPSKELHGSAVADLEKETLASEDYENKRDNFNQIQVDLITDHMDTGNIDGGETKSDSDSADESEVLEDDVLYRWCVLGSDGEVLPFRYESYVEASYVANIEWFREASEFDNGENDGDLEQTVENSMAASAEANMSCTIKEILGEETVRELHSSTKVTMDVEVEITAKRYYKDSCLGNDAQTIDQKTASAKIEWDHTAFDGENTTDSYDTYLRTWHPLDEDPSDYNCSVTQRGLLLKCGLYGGELGTDLRLEIWPDYGPNPFAGIDIDHKIDTKESEYNDVPTPYGVRKFKVKDTQEGDTTDEGDPDPSTVIDKTRYFTPIYAIRNRTTHFIEGKNDEQYVVDVPSYYPVSMRIGEQNDKYPVAYVGYLNRDELGDDWPVSAWEGDE